MHARSPSSFSSFSSSRASHALLVALGLTALACDAPSTASPASTTGARPAPPPAISPAVSASAAALPEPPRQTLFDSAALAFESVLAEKPRVLAVGEAHAQKGTTGIDSSAKRFTTELLPRLKGRAGDLLVELMLPAKGCAKKVEAVKEKQKVVTEKQAETDQNEYVTMGQEAKKFGIVPDLLRPSCADLDAIDKAGPDAIVVSLRTIARLTREQASPLLERGDKAGGEPMVVTYGGAMHNDTAPPPERADWCFGSDLEAKVKGRYVELDLYVPEQIQETESWRRLPWHPHFDRAKNPDKATLFQLGPRSYVLIFPATKR
jgi:hypothetical protein